MLDALIIIDDKGNIQSTNIAIEKIFGYKEEELVGENIKIGSYANRVGKPLLKMRKLSYSILLYPLPMKIPY